MPIHTDDYILWGLVGIGLLNACRFIPSTLHHIRSLTVVPLPTHPKPGHAGQPNAEEALKLSTIRTLAFGPSHEIRSAALKILATRSLTPDVRSLLLKDLASGDFDRRANAINAIWMLLYSPPVAELPTAPAAHFVDEEAFNAVITALTHLLQFHPPNPYTPHSLPRSPIKPVGRPSQEKILMIILFVLLRYHSGSPDDNHRLVDNINTAIRCGVVTRWLDKYPFPCAVYPYGNYHKSDIVSLFEHSSWGHDDTVMSDIINYVKCTVQGDKQLFECGLSKTHSRAYTYEGIEFHRIISGVRRRSRGLGGRARRGGSRRGGSRPLEERSDTEEEDNDEDEDADDDDDIGDDDDADGDVISDPGERTLDQGDISMIDGDDTAGIRSSRLQAAFDLENHRTPHPPPLTLPPFLTQPPTSNALRSPTQLQPQPRHHPNHPQRSREEESLRRRHREAVVVAAEPVLGEGDEPFRTDDSRRGGADNIRILQRENSHDVVVMDVRADQLLMRGRGLAAVVEVDARGSMGGENEREVPVGGNGSDNGSDYDNDANANDDDGVPVGVSGVEERQQEGAEEQVETEAEPEQGDV